MSTLTDRQAPRYATRRNPALPTAGRAIALTAAALGKPLMPWQRLVVDVAGERQGDRWRYPVVIVTVPRQAGKTTLVGAVQVHRGITRPGSRIFTTAQKGKDARARWRDLRDHVKASPLAPHVSTMNGAGTESLRFPNFSEVRPFAPTRDALHGETPPLVVIDEAWAFDLARGEDLMQAIRPAQITIRDRQLWIISTAGTAESAFLKQWVDTGRLAVDDPDAGVCYFEWSADEGADPYAPETWEFHPALGHTIELADLAAEADPAANTRANFERAFLNRWTTTRECIVDLSVWDKRYADQRPPAAGVDVHYGYAVARDRSRASIVAAWVADGTVHVRPYMVAEGTDWLASELERLRQRRAPLAVDDGGPARQATDALARLAGDGAEGLPVPLGMRTFATAVGVFLDGIRDGTLTLGRVPDAYDDSDPLRDDVESAALRDLGDGQRVLDRRRSTGPVDTLEAAIVATWQALHPETVYRYDPEAFRFG